MSEFSRETLLNIIETDHVQCGEASALASMALAAMDSEPVAEVLSNRQGNDTSTIDRVLPIGTQLYRHAQQPVVPEDIPDSVYEILCQACGGNAWMYSDALWNACRAAMLQELKKSAGTEAICRSDENVHVLHTKSPAQSDCCPAQNSVTPVQNKGWIPVSERMPEDEQEVLTINKMGHRFVSFFDKHSGLFFDRLDAPAACCIERVLVTHWMPLPAAPQEVK